MLQNMCVHILQLQSSWMVHHKVLVKNCETMAHVIQMTPCNWGTQGLKLTNEKSEENTKDAAFTIIKFLVSCGITEKCCTFSLVSLFDYDWIVRLRLGADTKEGSGPLNSPLVILVFVIFICYKFKKIYTSPILLKFKLLILEDYMVIIIKFLSVMPLSLLISGSVVG